MAVEGSIDKSGFDFYNIDDKPFRIYGIYRDGDEYRRMPESVASEVSESVGLLSRFTAGGRVRFVTDSLRLAFLVRHSCNPPADNGNFINRAGFDIYADGEYAATVRPGSDFSSNYYEFIPKNIVGERRERVITVNFPNYGGVNEVYVGITHGSVLKPAPDYKYEKPIVYYGSSITQGGCASRPGLAYEGIISRMLDTNYLNLGFSGNAKAEKRIAEYISELDMSVFVYDYDHNAPDVEWLKNTHAHMFRIIREKNPTLPIVMISRPQPIVDGNVLQRIEVIKETYSEALEDGDENVYFIDGSKLLYGVGKEGLVDGVHPNDLGFVYMANGIAPLLKEILEKN